MKLNTWKKILNKIFNCKTKKLKFKTIEKYILNLKIRTKYKSGKFYRCSLPVVHFGVVNTFAS